MPRFKSQQEPFSNEKNPEKTSASYACQYYSEEEKVSQASHKNLRNFDSNILL